MERLMRITLVLALAATSAGCRHEGSTIARSSEQAAETMAAPTNRVDVPPPVRTNLGMTFAKVEKRVVSDVLRAPGRFELLPSARREHRTPLAGRVTVLVQQYQRVEAGQTLYRLDSPQWRDLQRELADAAAAIDTLEARTGSFGPLLEAHALHEEGLREAVELWSARVKQLQELGAAGGGRAAELADAQAKLTEARAAFGEVMEKDAELQLRRAETDSALRTARARYDLLLHSAAALMGLPTATQTDDASDPPDWRTTMQLDIRATMTGVVEKLAISDGAWTEQGDLVLSVVNPDAVRFRAVGLQSDLARLQPGMRAEIVPPLHSAGTAAGATISGSITTTLEIGLDADPEHRTIELLATPTRLDTWTRPGVSAFLSIATNLNAQSELAIPLGAVVRDGLTPIIFRRDPRDPDKVIRLEADLGANDGRWIVINSGVKEGDQIVLDGVYQLLLATSGTTQRGGHFHADGTFHADDHD